MAGIFQGLLNFTFIGKTDKKTLANLTSANNLINDTIKAIGTDKEDTFLTKNLCKLLNRLSQFDLEKEKMSNNPQLAVTVSELERSITELKDKANSAYKGELNTSEKAKVLKRIMDACGETSLLSSLNPDKKASADFINIKFDEKKR